MLTKQVKPKRPWNPPTNAWTELALERPEAASFGNRSVGLGHHLSIYGIVAKICEQLPPISMFHNSSGIDDVDGDAARSSPPITLLKLHQGPTPAPATRKHSRLIQNGSIAEIFGIANILEFTDEIFTGLFPTTLSNWNWSRPFHFLRRIVARIFIYRKMSSYKRLVRMSFPKALSGLATRLT